MEKRNNNGSGWNQQKGSDRKRQTVGSEGGEGGDNNALLGTFY